jgi:predicted ATPase/class 3 adenylate cyclase
VRADLPTGTVTFLFTDVEGSTKLLHDLGAEGYAEALAEHRRVIRETCAVEGGVEVDTQGDAFFFAFLTAPSALAAAAATTEALASGPIQVRIGLHTGTPLLTGDGYVGGDVHRAARIAAAGHGGQVLVSSSTAQLAETELVDLGEHRLKDLSAAERIFQLGDGEFPPLRSLYRTNLPIPATPFLGRERELAEVVGLLGGTRLLTLTGPGGTGKTRLALQAVATAADSFPDGVFWVPLAPLRDPSLVLPTASQAVGAKNGLADHVADKQLLVLFDNFEQVAEAAPALSDLLSACPNLELVVTSREPLHLAGEQEYPVPSFVHEEGVGFFLAKARMAKPDFEPDEAVSEICRRLDDLPLALELAAARVKALTTAQILARLQPSLPLLTGGSRDLPERQRTLRATIEWSYDLLAEDERQLFTRLAVFRGGCTLEAAEAVCDAGVDTLHSLVDKSLVRFSNERYRMLETIREYAAELLAAAPDAAALAQAHAEHYLTLARAAQPELMGSAQAHWLDRLEADHDNLRAALDWSLEVGNGELGANIAVLLRRFWEVRGHFEEAKRYLLRLNAMGQPRELRVRVLRDLFNFTVAQNELDEAERYARERRDLCLAIGDLRGARHALQNLGIVADLRGDLDRAKGIFEEVLALTREADDEHVGVPLHNLASVAWKQGRLSDAEALYEEARSVFEPIGDDVQVAYSWTNLAGVRLYQGRRAEALPPLRRGLLLYEQLRSLPGLAMVFERAALATEAERAARLLGQADDLRAEIGERIPGAPDRPHALATSIATEALGQDGFDAAYAEGRAMSVDDAIALAREVTDA